MRTSLSLLMLTVGCSSAPPPALGLVNGALRPCPSSPNCVSSMADASDEHFIEPLSIAGEPDAAWAELAKTIAEMDGATVVENSGDYLHATFESFLFGFIDDLECLLERQASSLHCRSASRSGHYDFGVNRDRVEAIRKRLGAR